MERYRVSTFETYFSLDQWPSMPFSRRGAVPPSTFQLLSDRTFSVDSPCTSIPLHFILSLVLLRTWILFVVMSFECKSHLRITILYILFRKLFFTVSIRIGFFFYFIFYFLFFIFLMIDENLQKVIQSC